MDTDGEEEKEDTLKCKVIIVGGSGVGKTCIINRYIRNEFIPCPISSSGAAFTSKTIMMNDENQSIKFEIWDTAGQERFRSLNRIFYKKSDACILVYDITSRSSFEDLKEFWIREIRENAPENTSR